MLYSGLPFCWWVGSKQDFTRKKCKQAETICKDVSSVGAEVSVYAQTHARRKKLQALGISWVKYMTERVSHSTTFPASWQCDVSRSGKSIHKSPVSPLFQVVFTFSVQIGRFGCAAADEGTAGLVTRTVGTCRVLQCTEGKSANIGKSLCAHFHHLFDWCFHANVGNVPTEEWKVAAQQEAKALCRSVGFHRQISLRLSSWLGVSKPVRC